MKAIIYAAVGMGLLSFSSRLEESEMDGIWMGAYGAANQMETVVVKFNSENTIEWYKGEVKEENRVVGSYTLRGDSVVLSYTTAEGKQFTLNGYMNHRKNYLDGNWQTSDLGKGSFYLKKQKVTEFLAQP